jgi:hypothetical protein
MSGYVFHCTPCGVAHAGECPPKARDPFYAGKGSFESVELPQILGRAARGKTYSGAKATIVVNGKPIQPFGPRISLRHQGFMPLPHTIWRPETRQLSTDPWGPGNLTCFYEVMSAAGGIVHVRVLMATANPPTPAGAEYDYPMEHWGDDGHDRGNGRIMRFVPAP